MRTYTHNPLMARRVLYKSILLPTFNWTMSLLTTGMTYNPFLCPLYPEPKN